MQKQKLVHCIRKDIFSKYWHVIVIIEDHTFLIFYVLIFFHLTFNYNSFCICSHFSSIPGCWGFVLFVCFNFMSFLSACFILTWNKLWQMWCFRVFSPLALCCFWLTRNVCYPVHTTFLWLIIVIMVTRVLGVPNLHRP